MHHRFATPRASARLACAVLSALSLPAFAQSDAACSAMLGYTQQGVNLAITEAAHHASRQMQAGPGGPGATLPPHCHVEGEIDRRTGVDGKSYALRFAINMPDNWNGRFLFQGGGGLNGTLGEPVGAQAAGSQNALARGFAVVSTDSGHQGQVFDGSFMADQEAALNFLLLGNMRVTLAAKPLVEAYYDDTIDKSYFVGCSTGGREGMIMAQHYPQLYDGIVSGAPAIRTGLSNLGLRWMNVHWNQAMKQLTGEVPAPDKLWSAEEGALIVDGLLQACDALDGAEDGLVFDVAHCSFDPKKLACAAGQSENCIAPAKVEALVQALGGPVDSRGVQAYPGFLLDTGIDDRNGRQGGMLAGGSTPPEGVSVNGLLTQNVDAEFIAATATDESMGNATSLRVSTFAGRGGKHIFFHGVSDPWFSALDTIGYYQNMAAANGGLQTVDQWSRLFLVPGMGHCAGGAQTLDSFDMLTPLVEWVEKGVAPANVVATGNSMPGVSRPLCPYPQHPHYNGSGDIDDAASFQCRE